MSVDALLLYMVIGSFTPGPNNIMSSSISFNIGVKKALPFMLGVLVGTFLVFSISGIFYTILWEKTLIVVKYVGYFGAIYLLFLAIKMAPADSPLIVKDTSPKNLFLKAIFLSLINPKAIILGFTVSSMYLNEGVSFGGHLVMSLILATLCFVAVLLWGGLGYLFMQYLSKYQKVFNVAMATLLIFSAFLILLDAV